MQHLQQVSLLGLWYCDVTDKLSDQRPGALKSTCGVDSEHLLNPTQCQGLSQESGSCTRQNRPKSSTLGFLQLRDLGKQ